MTARDGASPSVAYELPSLWGAPASVVDRSSWHSTRRAEILSQYSHLVFGLPPEAPYGLRFRELSREHDVFGPGTTQVELLVAVTGPAGVKDFALLLYLPAGARAERPVPLFLGLNFKGNHGADSTSWPIQRVLERGYGVATLHNAELEGDYDGAASHGVQSIFYDPPALSAQRDSNRWGAIGVWAWGLSRALDVLAQVPEVAIDRVTAFGHSRLGKAALWASAQDERFAAVISNQSGCAGASLFRHPVGETIAMITEEFPHWFCQKFLDFQHAEQDLPLDQHHLLAAIAPRPVLVCSAADDDNADPRGEYLSTVHASPVSELFGYRGTAPMHSRTPRAEISADVAAHWAAPLAGVRVGGRLSYVMRDGTHSLREEDWLQFLDFADAYV